MFNIYVLSLILNILFTVYISTKGTAKEITLLRLLLLAVIPVVNNIMTIIYAIVIVTVLVMED